MIIRKTLISKVAVRDTAIFVAAILPNMAVAISIQMFLVLAGFLFISAVILYILDMFFLSCTSIGKNELINILKNYNNTLLFFEHCKGNFLKILKYELIHSWHILVGISSSCS